MSTTETIVALVLSPILGGVGWLVAHYGHKVLNARILKRHAWQRWLFQAEENSIALINAQTEVAVRKQMAADLVLEVPEPFEEAVMELSRFGYTFEMAALHEASRRGVYHLCDTDYRGPRPTVAPELASCDPPEAVTVASTEPPRLPEQGSPSAPPPPMSTMPVTRLEPALTDRVWSPVVGAFVRR